MKQVTDNKIQSAPFKTLPEFELLRKHYPKDEWLIIGTLTHAKSTSAATQLRHFRELIHALGKPNNTFGHRFHWICRVGGGSGTDAHTHLHFLLSRHQVTNGHKFSYTSQQVIEFMTEYWAQFGMKEHQKIEVFDSSRPGIEYVLREETRTQERIVEMSQALRAFVKNKNREADVVENELQKMHDAIADGLRCKGLEEVMVNGAPIWRKKVAA